MELMQIEMAALCGGAATTKGLSGASGFSILGFEGFWRQKMFVIKD
jgi:hypothetical protein